MKQRNIFLFAAIAVIIPALVFSVVTMPKSLTIVDSLEEELSLEQLIDRTPLIIKGTAISSQVVSDSKDPTDVSTIWKIQVSEILKGEETSKIISVKLRGGETLTNVVQTDGAKLSNNEEVILFLGKSPGSVYGDSYHLYSQFFGKYTLEADGTANSVIDSRDISENELIGIIKNNS
jgi:hypothetical protein